VWRRYTPANDEALVENVGVRELSMSRAALVADSARQVCACMMVLCHVFVGMLYMCAFI
jgi:hypothetical protein